VERPGDGAYRMQPIAVADATACALAAVERPAGAFPSVFDLVGPEAVPYARLLERLAQGARALGLTAGLRVREVPIEDAERRARAGDYQGQCAQPEGLDAQGVLLRKRLGLHAGDRSRAVCTLQAAGRRLTGS